MTPNYRQLADKEIATLTVYGCSAENWKTVNVVEDFTPNYFSNVHFSGNIFLGKYDDIFDLAGGIKKHSGIFNCHLHNCTVGNNVYIDKINNYIANYEIEDNAYIENVDLIVAEGTSGFGNGVKVATMIESGGREVPIYDKLSAPIAYMMTFYRHNSSLIESLEKAVSDYTLSQLSDKGKIGKYSRILNSGSLKNVRIGNFCDINGASSLENGSILSNESAPVIIGSGVQCNDFIIQSGTTVTESAMLTRCFVGQGCLIGKQFSAIDSLFFANCQGLHGEAVSIFAGPYTVTHHKATLMLTALYSFMNAGSGSNFSNHMYKLGPVHQGITERGVKTSSNSYIMWPAKIGAFSVVLGTHKGNPDISDLPFSYLIENNGETHLLPGINLHSAGTMRDVQKWPKRDLRTDIEKIDPICFDFLSPYTISKILNGIEILKELLTKIDKKNQFVWYQNCKIKRSAIRKGIELYEMAVDSFIGSSILKKLNGNGLKTIKDLASLGATSETGIGNWLDMSGLFTPKSEIERLTNKIVSEGLSVEAIQVELNNIFSEYNEFSWNFTTDLIQKVSGKAIMNSDILAVEELIKKGESADLTFNDLILRDAKKEFNSISKTGFGIDGDENDRDLDFINTRGTFENHPFVIELLSEK